MAKRASHPRLSLPRHKITSRLGEIVDVDYPLDHEVAGPLFEAGIMQLAIFDRLDYVKDEFVTPARHMIYLLLQGEFGVGTGRTLKWLETGDLAICPAGVEHLATGKKGSGTSFLWGTIADGARWEGLKKRGVTIRQYESADYLYLLTRRLLDAHATRDIVSMDHAIRDSYALVDLLMRENSESIPLRDETSLALKELVLKIRARPWLKWDQQDMADSLHMSGRSFRRAFKREFGITPKKMVMRQRMTLATRRLVFSNHAIKRIAAELGYADRQTFSDIFLKYVGMRPAELRRRRSS